MTTINDENRNALVVCKLSLERCRQHLAHLRALMHLCEPADLGMDIMVADSARDILNRVESELSSGTTVLEFCE